MDNSQAWVALSLPSLQPRKPLAPILLAMLPRWCSNTPFSVRLLRSVTSTRRETSPVRWALACAAGGSAMTTPPKPRWSCPLRPRSTSVLTIGCQHQQHRRWRKLDTCCRGITAEPDFEPLALLYQRRRDPGLGSQRHDSERDELTAAVNVALGGRANDFSKSGTANLTMCAFTTPRRVQRPSGDCYSRMQSIKAARVEIGTPSALGT